MKITEYPTSQFLDEGDVLIKDGTNGTKQIKGSDLVYALFDGIPEMHRQIFREKNLGTTYTGAQQQAISDGTFHDMWVGDYWEISGHKWRIVDFDYFVDADSHHFVLMCDDILKEIQGSSNSSKSDISYAQSNLNNAAGRDDYLTECLPATFSSYKLIHRELIAGLVNDYGVVTGISDSKMSIQYPTCAQILGTLGPNFINSNSNIPQMSSSGSKQFVAFALKPSLAAPGSGSTTRNKTYWLRDPCGRPGGQSTMTIMSDNGMYTGSVYITSTHGLRPYIAIHG